VSVAGSSIEWTDATWNPVTGCDRTSPGCDNCYALTLAGRLKAMGQPKYQNDGDARTSGPGFGLTLHPDELGTPLRWRKPRMVFVNSMSDLFHPEVPDGFILGVFGVMAQAEQHTFQILTKRPQRMAKLLEWAHHEIGWLSAPLPNVWLGTSVENQRYADLRIPHLLRTPAAIRFLSVEPLLGPVDLRLPDPLREPVFENSTVDWVIVGGESGAGRRPMDPEWARSIRDQCDAGAVPFFFKQWGGRTPKSHGRELDGRTWDELPEVATV
jgi:protein gp37